VTAADDQKNVAVAGDSSAVAPAEEKWLKLTREDLATSVAAYRQAQELRNGWRGAIPVLGGLLGALGLMEMGTLLGWPASLEPFFFFGGWAVALSGLFRVLRKDRRLLSRCQWHCPACNAEMIAPRGTNRLTRAETAIATGRCPVCGRALFESDSLDAPRLEPG